MSARAKSPPPRRGRAEGATGTGVRPSAGERREPGSGTGGMSSILVAGQLGVEVRLPGAPRLDPLLDLRGKRLPRFGEQHIRQRQRQGERDDRAQESGDAEHPEKPEQHQEKRNAQQGVDPHSAHPPAKRRFAHAQIACGSARRCASGIGESYSRSTSYRVLRSTGRKPASRISSSRSSRVSLSGVPNPSASWVILYSTTLPSMSSAP